MPEYDSALDRLHHRAETLSTKQDIPPSVNEQIDAEWRRIEDGVDPRKPENFGVYFQRRLSERYAETDPRDRSDEICGCGSMLCPLLRGEVPKSMGSPSGRPSSSPITPQDAKAWARRHTKPHIVEAVVADFEAEKGKTRRTLRKIIRLAREGSPSAAEAQINRSAVPGVADTAEEREASTDTDREADV